MRHVPGCGLAAAALCGFFLCACETPPPAGARGPTTPPPTDAAGAASPGEPASQTQPAEDGFTPTAPSGEAPAVPPIEAESPPYLTVTGVFVSDEPPRVREVRRAGQRLELDTYNVRRLRIDRAQLEANRRQSITLVLDGQGMEWHAASPIDEFERSRNGVWGPVRPDRARP